MSSTTPIFARLIGSRRARAAILLVSLPFCATAIVPTPAEAKKSRAEQLKGKIEFRRGKVARQKRQERVLSTHVARYSKEINNLQGGITKLETRQVRIQNDLDQKESRLRDIQENLRQERARLEKLRTRMGQTRTVLTQRMVELYKMGKPDVVKVVLKSEGFSDLIERVDFIERVSAEDARIIRHVKKSQVEAKRSEEKLASLEQDQREVTNRVIAQRSRVVRVKGDLVGKREKFRSAYSTKKKILSSVQSERRHVEEDLEAMEREQAKITGVLRQAASSGGGNAAMGPVRQGSGSMVWPTNGTLTSGFGPRSSPGGIGSRYHKGIDISAPTGRPIVAADSGQVVIMGATGGYGNFTCIQHSGSLSTCYGHQSRFATSRGASVSKGQVIGYVGNTGNSTGPHLHFEVRVNGTQVNPMGYL